MHEIADFGKWAYRLKTPQTRSNMDQRMQLQQKIDAFLNGTPFAVVGASRDRAKYGNKVLRVYQQNDRAVYPINPAGGEIEGAEAFADLASLPETAHGVSIITPPRITEQVVAQAIELGIKHLWMQPGAESQAAVDAAEKAGINVIAGDACILVVLGYSER